MELRPHFSLGSGEGLGLWVRVVLCVCAGARGAQGSPWVGRRFVAAPLPSVVLAPAAGHHYVVFPHTDPKTSVNSRTYIIVKWSKIESDGLSIYYFCLLYSGFKFI